MDPLTHGLIGASSAQLFSKNTRTMRAAALTGALAAMAADLDIFIHSTADPLLNVEIHRQFTHSILFAPLGALVVAALLWWFVRKWLSPRETYLFALAGFITAGIADSFTSYGTQLLWPFLDERFAWSLISVFAPVFSLGILVPLALALYHQKKKVIYFGWLWIIFYVMVSGFQQHRAEQAARDFALGKQHSPQKLIVKPSIGNQVLWGVRYIHADSIFSLAVRPGVFRSLQIYEGETAPLLNWRQEFEQHQGSTLYDDLKRFDKLSDGYLMYFPSRPDVIGDGRYAMVPTSITPLWGIKIDTSHTNSHVDFLNFREMDDAERNEFLKMLMGTSP